jgi:ATP-dependent DNA helicase RecG
MIRLDYVRVPGHEWVEDPDRRFDTVDMRGPIIRLIRRGEAAILDDLPRQFDLPPGELQRRDVPRIPERVIREAVVNALMHRSYRKQGPTQIIRYANRIEIRNPGHSLKAEHQFGEPGSETRNPAIAAVLHETDFAETKGSGIRVMRQVMRELDLVPPTLTCSEMTIWSGFRTSPNSASVRTRSGRSCLCVKRVASRTPNTATWRGPTRWTRAVTSDG